MQTTIYTTKITCYRDRSINQGRKGDQSTKCKVGILSAKYVIKLT